MATNKEWSQVVFFPRGGKDIETLVEGWIDPKAGVMITAVTDMDSGEPVILNAEEMQQAKECLYDSIVNF